jgi:hypothetical protein
MATVASDPAPSRCLGRGEIIEPRTSVLGGGKQGVLPLCRRPARSEAERANKLLGPGDNVSVRRTSWNWKPFRIRRYNQTPYACAVGERANKTLRQACIPKLDASFASDGMIKTLMSPLPHPACATRRLGAAGALLSWALCFPTLTGWAQ